MPNPESMNSGRSSGENDIHNNNRRRGASAMEGYNLHRNLSDLSDEERKKLVDDALNDIFGVIRDNSNTSSSSRAETGRRTPETRTVSPEARAARERAKRNDGQKKLLAGVLVGAVATAAVGGGVLYAMHADKANNAPAPEPQPNNDPIIWQSPEAQNPYENLNLGIYDGYGERGMFLSENKTSNVAFADAGEVGEICDFDECEMVKYAAHNQVETFADYMANLPEQLQPEGFKGLSLKETESRLESLSDEDFSLLENQFRNTIDDAFTRRVTKNGTFENAYMRHTGGDYVHGNMELVHCTTNEHNLEVTEFYWVDENGNEIGKMDVKITPTSTNEYGEINGFKGCMQVISEVDTPVYRDTPRIPDPTPEPEKPTPEPEKPTPEPDKPTPEPEKPTPEPENPTPEPEKPTPEPENPTPEPENPTPEPENPTPEPEKPTPEPETPTPTPLAPKDPDEEKEHAGPRVQPTGLDEEVTPPTTKEEDQENFDEIERQRQEDAEKKAEAERKAAEQAEAERKAAEEAEARRQAEAEAAAKRAADEAAAEAERQRQADEAAAKARAEAEAAQKAAAEKAAQEAAEREARERAQAEADRKAAQQKEEAESHNDDTAGQRADLFEGGDF